MTITTILQKTQLTEIYSLINEIKPKFPEHAIQLLDLCENLQSNLRTPFKGTVSIISSDLSFIECHVRITMKWAKFRRSLRLCPQTFTLMTSINYVKTFLFNINIYSCNSVSNLSKIYIIIVIITKPLFVQGFCRYSY